MSEPIGVALAAAILGAAWRRWAGADTGTGLGRLKYLPGMTLFWLVGWYATDDWHHGLIVAAILTVGFGDGVLFNPQKPLIYRYGFVTAILAVALVYLGHWAYWLAPVGCLVYLGYRIPKAVIDRWFPGGCWSCWGECAAGALLVGPLPLLRL